MARTDRHSTWKLRAKCGQRAITNSCSITAIRRASRTCERTSFYTFRTNGVTARVWRYGALPPLTTAPIVRIPPENICSRCEDAGAGGGLSDGDAVDRLERRCGRRPVLEFASARLLAESASRRRFGRAPAGRARRR